MAAFSSKLSLQIRSVQDQLSEELHVTESLTDYLYEEHVFEESEIMRIRFAQTPSAKASQMVRILQTRPDEDINKFIVKLKDPESQPLLAEQILKRVIEVAEKEIKTDPTNTARSTTKRMEDWTVEDVCTWLKSHQLDQHIVETFRSEKISGDVLSTVTMVDIESFCPAAKFGDRSRIIKSRDAELMKKTEKSSSSDKERVNDLGDTYISDKFQNFGRPGSSATPYGQNTCLPKEWVSSDDLIEPNHAFIGLQDVDKQEALRKFSVEIIPFICACLNDRTNGTCHLGVDADGIIHGIPADEIQFHQLLGSVVETGFSPDQLEIVRSCVRPIRFVEVKRNSFEKENGKLYVVEIDVVPVYRLCTDEAFFARATRSDLKSSDASSLYRLSNGLVVTCSGEDLKNFMENKAELAIKRREMERSFLKAKHGIQPDLPSDRLTRLLCNGGDSFDGQIYPIFVLSPNNNTGVEYSAGNTRFLQSIERKTVFDFDSASSLNSAFTSHEEHNGANSNVLSVEYFNRNDMLLSELFDDFSQSWIFCNGFHRTNEPVFDASEWKIKRKPTFSKAVQLLRDAIPREHGVVIFLLLSRNCEAMVSAAEDFCHKFEWMVISESQQLASSFKEHLVKTLKVVKNEEEFERRCIVRMPWTEVSEVFTKLVGDIDIGQVKLPMSSGSKVSIDRKVLNEMKDLEVLGSTHLDNAAIVLNNERLNELRSYVERQFYQGAEVDWWNFWFKTQVLTREIQPHIISCIQRLSTQQLEASDRVGIVAIYHKPGSGATTLAKNVLWELKDRYRCTVLKTLTKHTPNQLTRLLTYNETTNPKPVLALLDNYDEFQIQELKTSLELEACNLGRDIENPPLVSFILLVCIRCSSASQSIPSGCERSFELGYNLSISELQWFLVKDQELEREWQRTRRLDPSRLIAFNVFRENFNPHYIESKASSLVKFVTSYSDRLLLKFLAFIEVYDPDFRCVPASCFDQLMSDQRPFKSSWFSRISESLKGLISCRRNTGAGFPFQKLRIAHSLFAYHVFRVVASENEKPADVMLELLNSEIFRFKDVATKQLLKIVTSILTRSHQQRDGTGEHGFSPLIMSIIADQTQDRLKVINIFKRALELEDNIRVAEQLARFYAFTKDWRLAEELVTSLTEKYPTKGSVWKTCGLVYKEQLFHIFKEIQRPVTAEEVEASLGLVRRVTEMFQREENVGSGPSGFIGEGETILAFVDVFRRISGFQETELRRFFVDCDYVPAWLISWKQESIVYIRSVVVRAIYISEELESYYERIASSTNRSIQGSWIKKIQGRIINLTERLRSYLWIESSHMTLILSPVASTHYRRSQIFILKGSTLTKSLELCRSGNITILEQIKFLAEENLKVPDRKPADVQTFVRTSLLVFIARGNRTEINLQHDLFLQLKQLSKELVSSNVETFESVQIQIEMYLYFSLLNWPTGTSPVDGETVVLLKAVLYRWEKVLPDESSVNRGYDKCNYTSRILFSFGPGDGLNRIFIDRCIQFPVWFRGVVTGDGRKVSCSFNEHLFEIRLGRAQHRSRWGTTVFVRIGFTWSGPVAFDLVLVDPGISCPPCQPQIPIVPPCQPEIPSVPPCQPEIPIVPPCHPEIPIIPPCQPEVPIIPPCQPEVPIVPPCPPVVPPQPVAPPCPPPAACAPHHHHHHHHHGKHGHGHKKHGHCHGKRH